MKIVKLIGGLGNQMFQYALFLTLQDKGLYPKVDISGFSTYSLHQGLELEKVFGIDLSQDAASSEELDKTKDENTFFRLRKLIGVVLFSNPNKFIKPIHFVQPKFSHYYTEVFSREISYLDGYWQNEEYMVNCNSKIRQIFQWINVDNRNYELAQEMNEKDSISIHIRRLDKPNNLKQFFYIMRLRLVWRLASKRYYLKAIKYINNTIEHPEFYIFTDNIRWVKRNIPMNINFTIVDWNRGNRSNQDMFLMTQCKHNIISMSSFSWWGAWLNNNPKKIVIAPKKWAPRFSKDEIIPKEWIRL